jgi:hypothetical protein
VSWAIFLHGELIWGTVYVVFGGFGEVSQFSSWGIDFGHSVGGFGWILGS